MRRFTVILATTARNGNSSVEEAREGETKIEAEKDVSADFRSGREMGGFSSVRD